MSGRSRLLSKTAQFPHFLGKILSVGCPDDIGTCNGGDQLDDA
jgi:hypothetical protein